MDIPIILANKYPDSQWTLDGDSYEDLTWLSDTPKPTKKQLTDLWPTVEYEVAYAEVEQARAIAYRETSDPIFFEWQRKDATEAEWLAAVDAVKTAYPYPEAP